MITLKDKPITLTPLEFAILEQKSKMELITGVSHDLKTPLTSIIGYLELLRTESYQDQEEYNRFLQNSYNRAMHLKKLIDDLFEYTRLTTPDVQLSLKAVDVYELLEQMLVEFEPLAQEHHVSIIKKSASRPLWLQ